MTKLERRIAGAVIGAIVACVLLQVFSVFTWLKEGTWPSSTIYWTLENMGLRAPTTDWVGIQTLIDRWSLTEPIQTFCVFGAAMGFFLARLTERQPWMDPATK